MLYGTSRCRAQKEVVFLAELLGDSDEPSTVAQTYRSIGSISISSLVEQSLHCVHVALLDGSLESSLALYAKAMQY